MPQNPQEPVTTTPSQPSTEPVTTNTVTAEGAATSEVTATETPLRLLPKCFYCPECGRIHYGNDISFRANISGRAYGNAWLEGPHIEQENTEDDWDYNEMEYYCDHDDEDLSSELSESGEYIESLQGYTSRNNINLRAEMRIIEQYMASLRGSTTTQQAGFHAVDNQAYILQPYGPGIEDCTYIINPRVISEAIALAEQDEDLRFDVNNEIYVNAIAAFTQLLQTAAAYVDNANQNQTALPDDIRRVIEQAPNMAQFIGVDTAAFRPNRPQQEPDPLNSPIIELTHHRRWRENDLAYTRECEHCHYAFECDAELDDVPCPKCKKDTHNQSTQNA